jgi:hypothetical protein
MNCLICTGGIKVWIYAEKEFALKFLVLPQNKLRYTNSKQTVGSSFQILTVSLLQLPFTCVRDGLPAMYRERCADKKPWPLPDLYSLLSNCSEVFEKRAAPQLAKKPRFINVFKKARTVETLRDIY